jgi:AraC-like DNA-binding protein
MEIKELYQALAEYHGSIKQIADESGFSREYVRRVLKGEAVNSEIIITAASVLQKHREKSAEAADALDKLRF